MVSNEKVLQMHEELIDCGLIDLLPVDKSTRVFNKEFAKTLAVSLKEEGLYNPIAVRPNPSKPGRYILVQGRHRLYSWFRILKEKMIRATVLPTMDEQEAAMASAAENIWRYDGGKPQKIKALKIWHDYYAAKHAIAVEAKSVEELNAADAIAESKELIEATGVGVLPTAEAPSASPVLNEAVASIASGVADYVDAQDKKSKQNATGADLVAQIDAAITGATLTVGQKKSNKNTVEKDFVKQVAEATGSSKRTAQRDVRLAKMFSTEELEIFVQRGITQQQIGLISQVDAASRLALIALVASGMAFDEAWLQVFHVAVDLGGGTKDEQAAKAEARTESDADLSDNEWLTTYCSEKLEVLGHPEKFKADAILYRHTAEVRAKFRSRVKSHLAKTSEAGTRGALWGTISRLINISHPKDWHNCPVCGGAGEVDAAVCTKCNGAGYILRSEKFE